jgi:hypothetical protein
MSPRGPDPDLDAPSEPANVVTLVMDGGTAYVLVTLLAMTIDKFRPGGPTGGLARDVLIHAHDELAGQLGDPVYAERKASRGT